MESSIDVFIVVVGVEVVVVNIEWPVTDTERLVTSVEEALAKEMNIRYCIFSHISSMVPHIIYLLNSLNNLF